MGFLELLTLVFIVLKLTGAIDWSWLFVLMPLVVSLVIYAAFVTVGVAVGLREKHRNDRFLK